METQVRKNTVKLVCPPGSRIPSHLEVLKFALSVLEIPPPNLHSVYKDENENRFYLKLLDETKFDDFIRNLDEGYIFRYDDGSTVKVSLEIASRFFRYVRIFSLPPEVEDKDIAHVLGQYGTIRQHVRERFAAEHGAGIYTGVRGVHMEVAKEIPPHMYIRHYNVRIFYDGLRNRCWECKAEGHVKADCPRFLASSSGSSSASYAGVTARKRPGTVKSIPVGSSSANVAVAPGPSSTAQQAKKENERVVQSSKEPLVQQVETQGTEVETQGSEVETIMEIDEAKMAHKRAAGGTSSEEGETVTDEDFITPKSKRAAKKNKGTDAVAKPKNDEVPNEVEANPVYQLFKVIGTEIKKRNDELLSQREEEEAKTKSQLRNKKKP